MNRRKFLGVAVGTAAVAATGGAGAMYVFGGNSGNDTGRPEEATDVPPEVEKRRPLAKAFYKEVKQYFPEARVFVTHNGEIAMDYTTDAETKEGLKSEIARIAVLFTEVVEDGDFEATTLSVYTGKVQGIAPVSSVRAKVNGEINEEAFIKTVSYMEAERNDEG